jgi:hypothetical protein
LGGDARNRHFYGHTSADSYLQYRHRNTPIHVDGYAYLAANNPYSNPQPQSYIVADTDRYVDASAPHAYTHLGADTSYCYPHTGCGPSASAARKQSTERSQ